MNVGIEGIWNSTTGQSMGCPVALSMEIKGIGRVIWVKIDIEDKSVSSTLL